MNTHKFIVTVKTTRSGVLTQSALMTAFGVRQPDGCEFYLTKCGSKTVRSMVNADARNEIRSLTKRNRTQAKTISRYQRLALKMTGQI